MPYRTICTIAAPEGADALEGAIDCARAWSAHLDVIAVSALQFEPPVMVVPDLPVAGAGLIEEAVEELSRAEARVRARLAREDFPWSVTNRPEPAADAAWAVVRAARFADIAILPGRGRSERAPYTTIMETMLYNSRVPLLVANGPVPAAPRRIALAWDGSDVALAAVRAALPLLHAAAEVEIVAVDPDRATDASARDLAVMLDRHGIGSEVTELPRRGAKVAEILCAHATETAIDLMVMGAYGTRRFREILLGGVTRAMLDAAPVPLLLAR